MRLQKYLAHQGYCSRRKAEEYILNGWISVNGTVVTTLGISIDPDTDQVEVSPEVEKQRQSFTYLIFNKPVGIVTNCPQNDEQEIKDILPEEYKSLSAVGRLDKDSEGLILLTDDGVFSKHLLNDENPHQRIYEVWLNGYLTQSQLLKLEDGMRLFGYQTRPVTVKSVSKHKIEITMTEGKNRQIRRVIQKIGLRVLRLRRIRFAHIYLGNLRPGRFRPLTEEERAQFRF